MLTCSRQTGDVDKVTGKVVGEFDISDELWLMYHFLKGFKPGGSNLTYGYTEAEDIAAGRPVAPAMVFQTYESENIEAIEVGLKTDLI